MSTKYVVSASRRTDIPCWHSEWFMGRLRDGVVKYQNPMGPQVVTVSLKPEDVQALVFWTKDFGPMLRYMPEFEAMGIPYYTQFTLNDYPREYEQRVPKLSSRLRSFKALAERGAPVYWRYDPVLISEHTPVDWHLQKFEALAKELRGYTKRVHVSILSMYAKTRRNLPQEPGFQPLGLDQEVKRVLLQSMQLIARTQDMTLLTCCEADSEAMGIQAGACVDRETLCGISGGRYSASPTREGCGCVAVRDIGAYDTCPSGCRYCYAVGDHQRVQEYMRAQDRQSVSMRPLPISVARA